MVDMQYCNAPFSNTFKTLCVEADVAIPKTMLKFTNRKILSLIRGIWTKLHSV